MNYGELKTAFISAIGRSDLTDAEVAGYLEQGIRRIQRTLRIPSMEKLVTFTDVGTELPIPNDFLEAITLLDEGNFMELKKRSLTEVLTQRFPYSYARNQDELRLNAVNPTDTVNMVYYAADPVFELDTDTSPLASNAPDLVMAAALIPACIDYLDERLPVYESRYGQLLQEIIDQATLVELTNAVQASPHPDAEY